MYLCFHLFFNEKGKTLNFIKIKETNLEWAKAKPLEKAKHKIKKANGKGASLF